MNTGGDGNAEDDDNVSLVSRSPSPRLDAMDVEGISKYDEFVAGEAREVITVETRIKNTNKGFAMLAKLGWSEGQPLGLSGDGRVDPIPFQVKRDSTGLGKTNQDVRMIETTVSQRRGLDSERQTKETEEQRQAREDSVARRAALQSELSDTLKAFYCSLCDKQFKNVAQYDEHTNSYAHHHKARFRDMQANARTKPKEEADKRKEKERKREEKELRKIAAAAGMKMAKPPALPAPTAVSTDAAASSTTVASIGSEEIKPAGFKKSGWASLSSVDEVSPDPRAAATKSGWASVGSSSSSASQYPRPPPLPSDNFTPAPPAPVMHQLSASSAPAFRTAGWTSLDTGTLHPLPPPPSLTTDLPPPPPPSVRGGWSAAAPPAAPHPRWSNVSVPSAQQFAPDMAPRSPPPAPSSSGVPPPPPTMRPPSPVAATGRAGWQQFQAKGPKRR